MEADSDGVNAPLQLEPFIHQVSGHASMLQLDQNTICKPLMSQELNFYKNSPECLKRFMPEFKGVVEVTFSTDNEGYLSLTTYLPLGYTNHTDKVQHQASIPNKSDIKVKHRISMLHRIRVCHAGNIQIESDSENGADQRFEERQSHSSGSRLNPWVLHCHQEQIKRIQNASSVFSQKYILLENLTSKYEFPCVLDVKMGTRSYGDDASAAKRQSQMAKVASTTSSTLGVRICGIQVYHHDSGHYICHNKYYGRGLTVDGFHQALYHFLHNGTDLRHDIISELIKKLHKLQEVIQNLDTFRFFTSSLLIIYDGKRQLQPKKSSQVIACRSLQEESHLQLCKNGNMTEINQMNKNLPSDSCITNSYNTHEFSDFPCSLKLSDDNECENAGQRNDIVDVRMIDFAHSTQSQMPESCNVHSGPDDGYLFGLRNLIAQLKSFQQEGDQQGLF